MQRAPYANVKILLRYMQKHPDTAMPAEQIREDTGIASGSLAGTARVIMRDNPELVRAGRGFYKWDTSRGKQRRATKSEPESPTLPLPEPEPMASVNGSGIFKQIGSPTSSGGLVLQSESGEVFLAHQL